MPAEVARKFRDATHKTIRDGFGQTETALLICFPVGEEPVGGALGRASEQYDIFLADEDGNPVPDGQEGEIVVCPKNGQRPAGILSGYLNDEALYEEVWRGGHYHTGDRARKENGLFFYIGRTDDVIKSSGYRIGPSEVEDLLMELNRKDHNTTHRKFTAIQRSNLPGWEDYTPGSHRIKNAAGQPNQRSEKGNES